MKWKPWSDNHVVLVDEKGEVVDEIKRNDDFFFVLKSNGKKYIDLKSAKKARMTGTDDGKRD
jgi:hypothetical protein